MKKIQIGAILLFFLMLLFPVAFFNREEAVISEIDNRQLQEFPSLGRTDRDLTESIEAYINDRIGGRNKLIKGYIILNDKLFGMMVHPTYTYGKDGYVFFKMKRNIRYGEFHREFAEMVRKLQTYCEERNVPFVFCFNPAKITVLSGYLPEGVNYDSSWVQELMNELEKLGVNYVDNTALLIEKSRQEAVFNQKYDAGHWNDLGAFYGMNHLFEKIHSYIPEVTVRGLEDFEISTKVETTLPVSHFPIHEEVPVFSLKNTYEDRTAEYSKELELDPSFRHFNDWVNRNMDAGKLPRMLVFQGSYLNSRGKLVVNNTQEYIGVHNYQNVLNIDYYFNIFKPDCVIFEVAEYTLNNRFFDLEKMKQLDLNPSPERFAQKEGQKGEELSVTVEEGNALNRVTVKGIPENAQYVYFSMQTGDYDARKTTDGYEVTLTKEDFRMTENKVIYIDREGGKYISQVNFE